MYVEPEAVTPSPASAVAVDDAALRALPARRPADPPVRASRISWRLVDADRYEVTVAGRVAGYIDTVGALFVVLAGEQYPKAVEITQTLVWSTAITALDAERG